MIRDDEQVDGHLRPGTRVWVRGVIVGKHIRGVDHVIDYTVRVHSGDRINMIQTVEVFPGDVELEPCVH